MKQYSIIFVIIFVIKLNAYELMQNHCALSYEINEKTVECIIKWPKYEDNCIKGKSLLIDYFNLTKCDLFKRIQKPETTIRSNFVLTHDSIYKLGNTVDSNCNKLNNGYMKCFSTFGSIKCVQRSNKCNFIFILLQKLRNLKYFLS